MRPISGRSWAPRKFPVSGRSRQHAEVAAAVAARRRYQRGEAVEQFQRRRKKRAVPARKMMRASTHTTHPQALWIRAAQRTG